MKIKVIQIILITCTFFLSDVKAQTKNIQLNQFDPRFTISAKKYWSSLAGSEEYFFYVQNNTSDEYKLEIYVTLNLACVGTKSFRLGVNKIVYLKPNGRFSPDDDWSHIITSGADNFKSCRLADGKSYTLLQGISYEVQNITNITIQKAQEEKKKREEKEVAEKKAEEEKRLREEKAAAEKKAAEEKRIQDEKAAEEKRKSAEKKAAEEKRKSDENAELEKKKANNPTSSQSSTSSDINHTNKSNKTTENPAEAKQKIREEEIAREKAIKEAEEARLKAEQEARDQRQREYDAWKQSATEQRNQAEASAAAGSIGILAIFGQWIYNDKMGVVNPNYVYNQPRNLNKVAINASVEWGYSGSYIPLLYPSEKTTMIRGTYVTTKSLENNPIFLFNLDLNLKIGFEHDYFGGYAFLAPKIGFSPIFDGSQVSLGNYGGRLFAGIKNVKVYGEYMGGDKTISKKDNDPEENGKGKFDNSYEKMEYGLRFTTNADLNYKRNHISIGILRQKLKTAGLTAYIHPSTGSVITSGVSPWVEGYSFQWKKDHTFNFYVNYYPAYLIAGDIPFSSGQPNSLLQSNPTANFIEFGFLRSIDFF